MASSQLESPGDEPQDGGPWKKQASLNEQRHDIDGRGALGTFDVFALIVNKMIGTGIYTAPASVFLMTGDKKLTLGLFGIGFAYTLVSMVIYLDYAKVLPFNGGELIYLDEIASHVSDKNGTELRTLTAEGRQRPAPALKLQKGGLLGDGLLVFIIYSISFVVFFNSGANAMQFGRMILLCISADKTTGPDAPIDVHRDLMRFIGIFVLSLICLFQYFSPNFGRSLNKTLAVAKIFMLFGVLVAAGIAAGRVSGSDWDFEPPAANPKRKSSKGVSFAKALLAVLFSFEGWENATFVTGEIPEHKHHVLRNGFITAVITVGCLYLAIVAAFLHFIDGGSWTKLEWTQRGEIKTNVNYVPMFSGNDTESRRAWAAMAAMSSFGSLNAIIYTFSRVKQTIGHADILPWSRFWKQDDILQRNYNDQRYHNERVDEFLYKSPQGGLIVHWAMSVVLILATIGISNTPEAVGLPGYIQTYIHCAVLAFLGMGFFKLKSREAALWPKGADTRRSKRHPAIWWLLYGTVVIYIFINLAILIVTAIKPYTATDGSDNAVQGWAFLLIVCLLLLVGTVYYVLFFGAASRRYEHAAPGADRLPLLAPSLPVVQEGMMQPQNWWNWMRWAGVQCEVRKSYTYDRKLERVYRFGRRWRIIYYLPRDADYQASLERRSRRQARDPPMNDPSKSAMFFYWLFGGTRLNNGFTPVESLGEWWMETKRKLRNLHVPMENDTDADD